MSTVQTPPPRRSSLAREHSPNRERPVGSYALLMGTFTSSAAGFAAWFHRSGRELPERIDLRDLALLTVASHKAARVVTKDRVTSAVRAPLRASSAMPVRVR